MKCALVIPAHNEELSIAQVLDSLPSNLFKQIIVVNNGSTDKTGDIARSRNVIVVDEPQRGYGRACLSGISAIDDINIDIVVFMDADASDDPADLHKLLKALEDTEIQFVIGSRATGNVEKGAMTFCQRFGNMLATNLISYFWGFRYTDLGPLRAIRFDALKKLNMRDTNYGWTVEMQIKAIQHGLNIIEVPATYRQRIGKSKISGTVSGVVKAGYKIIYTIVKYRFFGPLIKPPECTANYTQSKRVNSK